MNEPTATRHQRLRRRVRVAGWLSGGLLLSAVAFTPISRRSSDWLLARIPAPIVAAIVFVTALVLLLEVAALPGVAYVEARSRRRQRRARAPMIEVLTAQGQATLVTLMLATAGAAIWSLSVRVGQQWWWALAAALLAALLVIALRLAPSLLARLADVRPVARPALVARLERLARDARVSLSGVHEWRVSDDAEASALVTGAGQVRRVLIASSVLRDWSDEEIAVIVAHELAHHRHHDLHMTLVMDASLVAVAAWAADVAIARLGPALGLTGPADLAALPVLMLFAGAVWIAVTPVRHAVSRWQERRADRFALRLTNGAEAFSTAVRRLGAQHLAEERPSLATRWFFGRHPSVTERLALAEAHRRGRAS